MLNEYARQVFEAQLNILQTIGKVCIYENQKAIARKVFTAIMDVGSKALYALVVALTQSGKTGSMIEVVRTAIYDYRIPVHNIFIITGLSSKEWKDQTINRFPDCMKDNIFHRNDVEGKLELTLRGKRDVLIIIDEMHMAAKDTQTISKVFQACKLDDPEYTLRQNIRIVEYSATPDGVLRDRLRLDQRSEIIFAEPGKGYIGPFELITRNDVFQAKDLSEMSNVVEMYDHIKTKFDEPKYHIIRVHTRGEKKDAIIQNFIQLETIGNFITKRYNHEDTEIYDLNSILKIPPEKHTFIFIKDMLRCAKTLEKMNIGIVYERMVSTINDTAIIQGLLGRVTGYDVNDTISVFTNIDTIKRYKLLWDSEFKNTQIPWNSNTKNCQTYAIDKWRDDGDARVDKNSDIRHRLFEDHERFTTLVEFTKKYFDGWTPGKNTGIDIKELQNYTSKDIVRRKWGISKKKTRRLIRGCDGIWVVLWSGEAHDC